MISMKRMIDDIQKMKQTPRVWRFRKEVPERVLLYVAPPVKLFSLWTKSFGLLAALFLGPALVFSVSTNAAFSDTDHLSSQAIGTGEWVPDIHFEEHDGCVKLSSSFPKAKIYYKFSHDGDPRTDGKIFDGECIEIPEGKDAWLQARAFHPKHERWRSKVLEKIFSKEKDRDYDGDRNEQENREKKEWDDFSKKEQEAGVSSDENEKDAAVNPGISNELIGQTTGG